ncbi:hypothetical protein QN277_011104 [Acacia crassicarpa]|uniref:Uncharacterized protein n=1 Tax=Acacia crassicarpa TaxID=499986 RepID=A0AAE1TCY5_9FABA|nr:hypothetical protein QN277_011104 [Acacia crassicarpa]
MEDGVCSSFLLLHSLSFVLHPSAGFITMGTSMSLPVPFGHLKLRIHAFVHFLMKYHASRDGGALSLDEYNSRLGCCSSLLI